MRSLSPSKKRYLLCFSSKDAEGKAELAAHLSAAGSALTLWSVDELRGGESIPAAFQEAAARADAALLLLSADFFAELAEPVPGKPAEHSLCWQIEEVRRQHSERKMQLIPIVWRPCDWRSVPWLAKLRTLPGDGSAVALHDSAQRDQMWADIAQQLGGRARVSMNGLLGAIRPAGQVTMPARAALIAKAQNLLLDTEEDFERTVDVELSIHRVPQLVKAQHLPHKGARNPEEVRLLEEPLLDYVLRMERLLLVGQPGAGKTQTLRTLCSELLAMARADPTLPIPFMLNFSTFSNYRGSLREWLAEGLKECAAIPVSIGQALLQQGQLFLLLDGFDEMAADRRGQAAIELNRLLNAADPALARCVVCSRTLEYAEANIPLALSAALELQPLSLLQAQEAMAQAGTATCSLKCAISHDQSLASLLRTPLVLTIAVRAYFSIVNLSLEGYSQVQVRQILYDAYIVQMLRRKTMNIDQCAILSLRWLRCLAQHLAKTRSSLFLIERMQPTILTVERTYLSAFRLIRGLIAGLAFGLAIGLIFRLSVGIVVVPILALSVWLGIRLALVFGCLLILSGAISILSFRLGVGPNNNQTLDGLLVIGLGLALPVDLISKLHSVWIEPVEYMNWSWRQAIKKWNKNLLIRICFWKLCHYVSGGGMIGIGIIGIIIEIVIFIWMGWIKAIRIKSIRPNEGILFSMRNGLLEGAIAGMSVAVVIWLIIKFSIDLISMFGAHLGNGINVGVGVGLLVWLSIGFRGGLGVRPASP